jgi:3-oxoacyl-[acyl-carrier protein] reductase
VDLGLQDRVAVVAGARDATAEACRAELTAEGALVLDSVEAALGAHGRVDVVVYRVPSAGALELDAPELALEQAWDPVVDAIATYHAALPSMRAHGWGRIVAVTTTGVRAVVDDSEELDLVAGLGLLGVHKVIASEEGPHAVTVNAVLSTGVSEPRDVAAAVAFLASVRAGYLTGITLSVDAGVTPSIF